MFYNSLIRSHRPCRASEDIDSKRTIRKTMVMALNTETKLLYGKRKQYMILLV
jgi:hypothetical protein